MLIPKKNLSLPRVIDSTIRSDYVSCHTKGFWSFQAKLGPADGSPDLIAGGAFAKGLEVLRRCYYGPEKLDLDESLKRGMLAALAELDDYQFPEHKSTKGPDRICEALAAYVRHWKPDEDHIQPHYDPQGNPSVEYTFSVPLPIDHPETGEPFIYAGRFDMLGVFQNQLVVVDEKTCSQLGPTWPHKWDLRGQFTGYVWACHQYGLPVIGAIVRGVRFTKTAFSSESFMQSIQMRPMWQLVQWYDQMLEDVEAMVKAWKRGKYNQVFNDTCAEYSGCPFATLCQSPEPENWIAGKFSVRDWDPLKKVPYVQPKQEIEVVQDENLKNLVGV